METKEFTVTGMTCGHCERAITQEVTAVDGVIEAHVNRASETLTVTLERPLNDDLILVAVGEAGYSASAQ